MLNPSTQTVYVLRLSDGTELWRATGVRSTDPHRGGLVYNQAVVAGGVLCYTQRISRERVREATRTQDGAELWHALPTMDLSRNLATLLPEVTR